MITSGVGKKFREELFLGVHALSEGADVLRVALYGPNADIGPDTDAYTVSGEVSGGGYTAGGVVALLTVVGATGSSRAAGPQFAYPYAQPTNDLEVSVTGVAVRGVMLYNSSQNNRNIFTLNLGENITPTEGLVIRWALSGVVAESHVLIPLLDRSL